MATATVIDFFERLSDGWIFDASHFKKVWSALRKDKDAAGTQLAKCLLVYIRAPEKHECDKTVPRCMKEWSGHMPQDSTWKAWGEDVIGSLLGQLAEWIPQAAKHSRVRVLSLIVAILRGLRQDTCLEDGIRTSIVEILLQHLPDKDEKVRQLVVIALTKLGFPGEVDYDIYRTAGAPELLSELVDALHSDISQDVRMEIVSRLPLNKAALAEVLRHQSDRSAKVAASVYDKVARDVPLAHPATPGGLYASPEQRTTLLWYGLHEPRTEVRSAALGLLVKWFTVDAASDIVVLLEALDPQANTELCQLILEQLVANEHWDPLSWLKAETAAGRSIPDLLRIAEQFEQQEQRQQQEPRGQQHDVQVNGASGGSSWLASVRPALVFTWSYACRNAEEVALERGRSAAEKVAATVAQAEASAGAQAEEALETFLPTARQMVKLCLLAAEAGLAYHYIAAQLLDLASLSSMNWVDASSRQAAEAALLELITRTTPRAGGGEDRLPTQQSSMPKNNNNAYLPAASGGSGAWEAAVLRFAAAVYGSDSSSLLYCVLPVVLKLAAEGFPSSHSSGGDPSTLEGPRAEAPEGHLLQALTFLHLLMTLAGPGLQPSASAPAPAALQQPQPQHHDAAVAGVSDDGRPSTWSLAQAVDWLAWTGARRSSPTVRAAAIRCYVQLCLRDGGLEHLPPAVRMLTAMLPAATRAATATATAVHDDDGVDFATQNQLLPQRVALQGLIDLALTWGEPTVTSELKKFAVAAATTARITAAGGSGLVDDLTAQMAGLGVDQDKLDGGHPGLGAAAPAAAPAAAAAAASEVAGVVPILLRLTAGVVRKLQGSTSGYVAARGVVADALLGSSRLVHGWSFQLRLNKRLRHQVITAMQPRLAEQLLTRLLLARFSPALESEPWLRSQLSAFFKAFQEAASTAGEEGSVHRRMLAGSFLQAARCAMALPAPPGAPATARGCAAPALMEFAAELLASAAARVAAAAAAAAEAVGETGDDVVPEEDQGGPAAATAAATAAASGDESSPSSSGTAVASDAVVWLCELVLEEVIRLGSPGSSSLDTNEGRVRAYAAELCKTPMRLLPGLPAASPSASAAVLASIRRLAYLGRRAVMAAGENLVKTVVPDTAYKKLQEFVRELEDLQQVKAAPLSEADARAFLLVLREKLKGHFEELPSLEDVTEDLAPDSEWDVLTADASQKAGGGAGGDQTRASKRRGAAARGTKGETTKTQSRTTTMTTTTTKTTAAPAPARTTRQTSKALASRGPASSGRRHNTRNVEETDDNSSGPDQEDVDEASPSESDNGDGDGDDHDDDDHHGKAVGGRLRANMAAAKAGKGRVRGAGASGAGAGGAACSARSAASQDTVTASDTGSELGRRPTRAAATKASVRLEALREGKSKATPYD